LTSDPTTSQVRQHVIVGDGPQTLKTSHDSLDLWIPLIFWFNNDFTKALPVCTMLSSDLKIDFKISDINKLAGCVDYGGGGQFNTPTIREFQVYVNHIETVESIKTLIISKKIYCIPIRTYDYETLVVNEASGKIIGNKQLKSIHNSVESLYIGFKPKVNEDSLISWPQQCIHEQKTLKMPVVIDSKTPSVSINTCVYFKPADTVDSLSFVIDGIDLYSKNNIQFYNRYMNAKLQNDSIESYTDFHGWNYIDFSLASRSNLDFKNHLGYINFTRNREFYIEYTSNNISVSNPSICTVISRCIKWVVIRNGTVQFLFS
jgi:hypothetical protein